MRTSLKMREVTSIRKHEYENRNIAKIPTLKRYTFKSDTPRSDISIPPQSVQVGRAFLSPETLSIVLSELMFLQNEKDH